MEKPRSAWLLSAFIFVFKNTIARSRFPARRDSFPNKLLNYPWRHTVSGGRGLFGYKKKTGELDVINPINLAS